MRSRAFSFVELLIVAAVLVVLAALLFPLFAQAKKQAKHISWSAQMRQTALGVDLYTSDYDDRYMLPRLIFDQPLDPRRDRTWVQALLPYLRDFDLFVCPLDKTRPPSRALFDPDLPGPGSDARYYTASTRSNIGFNFTYLSPVVRTTPARRSWQHFPRAVSEIENPARTLLFADSAWEIVDGKPRGGGNYLVLPPCRFANATRALADTFGFPTTRNNQFYTGGLGWLNEEGGEETVLDNGGLYPWFGDLITIAYANGDVRRVPYSRMTNGCQVEPDWKGLVSDRDSYIWDLK